jgi:hypothetical protein
MDPKAILSESPSNYAIDNTEISQIKLQHKNINRGNQTNENEFRIEVISTPGIYEFRMEARNQFVELLKRVYDERVKMPFGYFSSHGVQFKVGF